MSENDKKLTLKFPREGSYSIKMRSYQGDCYEDFEKNIVVLPLEEKPLGIDRQKSLIEEFVVFPSPSDGLFKTKVGLTSATNIKLKVLDLATGVVLDEREAIGQQDYILEYQMNHLPSGLYFVLLETSQGTETRKLVIN